MTVPADVVPRRHRLSEGSSDLAGQILPATVRAREGDQSLFYASSPLALSLILCLLRLSCDWSDRAVKRLETARVQKDVVEATKVVRQQELHKSLRVRWEL